MGKRKERPETQVVDVPADHQDHETRNAPRRAKTTALNNAVWMQLAPKARSKPLKRVAATNSAKPSASKRGRKKQKTGQQSAAQQVITTPNAAEDEHVTEDEYVSIPVPPAPKKPQRRANQVSQKSTSHKEVPSDPFIEASEASEPENDEESTDNELSHSNNDTGEDAEDSDGLLDESDGSGDSEGRNLTVAEKRFGEERGAWSDREDEQHGNWAPANFIIHGQHIVVSNNDDDGADDSPTAHLICAGSQAARKEPLQTSKTLNSTQQGQSHGNAIQAHSNSQRYRENELPRTFQTNSNRTQAQGSNRHNHENERPCTIQANSNPTQAQGSNQRNRENEPPHAAQTTSNSAQGSGRHNRKNEPPCTTQATSIQAQGGSRHNPENTPSATETKASMDNWPDYTTLVRGAKTELSLNIQTSEVQDVIRIAIALVERRVRFENAFPSLPDRDGWYAAALAKSCNKSKNKAHGEAMERFGILRERVCVDRVYVNDIGTLLGPRISLLRGITKTFAVINTRAAYGLQNGCTAKVQDLLRKKQYIYPRAPNSQVLLTDKPFEHSAIIGTLHDDLFGGCTSIVKQYPQYFKLDEEDKYALTPSMVALAATAVFAALREWENGRHTPAHFTSNVFANIYHGHVQDLEDIRKANLPAYNALLRRLFIMAADSASNSEFNQNLTVIANMAVDT